MKSDPAVNRDMPRYVMPAIAAVIFWAFQARSLCTSSQFRKNHEHGAGCGAWQVGTDLHSVYGIQYGCHRTIFREVGSEQPIPEIYSNCCINGSSLLYDLAAVVLLSQAPFVAIGPSLPGLTDRGGVDGTGGQYFSFR